ncbi:MAG: SMC-Scp complex subunit ScpB [bacterium]|nr:SMC-Scp complex subunit ScpB [bacterium]
MDAERRRALEAVLMVTTEPVAPQLLAQLLEISVAAVEAALADLAGSCDGRGFVLERVAGGYRFASHPDCAPYVERFVLGAEPVRLSGAALETLGIIAYRQPVSRAQIAAVRGVNVDGVVRTLQRRGLIAEVARDPGPGNAVLFGTTGLFLESLGLDSLADLPPLGEFVPEAEVAETFDASLRSGQRPRRGPSAKDATPLPEQEALELGDPERRGPQQSSPERPA